MQMTAGLDDRFQMPDKMVALLIRFIEQNNDELSKRAKDKEFAGLTEKEAKEIEQNYITVIEHDEKKATDDQLRSGA